MKIVIGFHVGRELVNAISSARERVWICTPYIGRKAIEILSKLGSDIDIKIVTRQYVENREAIEFLMSRGIDIKILPSLHAKIYIVDRTVFIGSMNLTDTSLFNNIEASIVLDYDSEKDLVLEVEKAFEMLWSMAIDIRDVYP